MADECIIDDGKHYDRATDEYVYTVICCNPTHPGPCPYPVGREIIRREPRRPIPKMPDPGMSRDG